MVLPKVYNMYFCSLKKNWAITLSINDIEVILLFHNLYLNIIFLHYMSSFCHHYMSSFQVIIICHNDDIY